jgi:hypothetical protein
MTALRMRPTAVTARPKRPRDPNQLGKLTADIAVGEVEDRGEA